jgi:hypothetical protein
MNNARLLLILPVAVTTLSGCVAPAARYPSLLSRAVEQQPMAAVARPEAPAAPIAADPALDAQLAALAAALATSADAFQPATARATASTDKAKGAAIGSEAWLSAQSALGALDTLRSQSLSALSDLDRLTIDRATAGQPAYPALTAARNRAEAQLAAQQSVIDSLQGQIAAF